MWGETQAYTSRAGFIFIWGVSLTHPMLCFIFLWGVSLTHPMLASFISGVGFSYTSHAGFIFIGGEFLLHIPLAYFLSREFLLHIPCLLYCSSLGVSLTHSHAGFILFYWGTGSLTHPILALIFWGISFTFLLA